MVEIPQIIWQPILRGIILNTRPQKSAQAYAKVWTDKGSPLAFFTAGQAAHPFAFMSSWAYNTHYWGGWPSGVRQLTYTAVLGGGFSTTFGGLLSGI